MPRLSLPQDVSAIVRQPETSDVFVGIYVPYECFKFAAGATDAKVYDTGVEYDRHNLGSRMSGLGHVMNLPGRLLHTRLDYAAEITPIAILRQPSLTDKWGNALSTSQKSVPGMGISPLGFRMLWLGNRTVKPFWSGKVGGIVFTQKALSPTATYANFMIQVSAGTQFTLTPRADVRLGYEFFHFSNLYVNNSNPGLDNLGINFGMVYHLPGGTRW